MLVLEKKNISVYLEPDFKSCRRTTRVSNALNLVSSISDNPNKIFLFRLLPVSFYPLVSVCLLSSDLVTRVGENFPDELMASVPVKLVLNLVKSAASDFVSKIKI